MGIFEEIKHQYSLGKTQPKNGLQNGVKMRPEMRLKMNISREIKHQYFLGKTQPKNGLQNGVEMMADIAAKSQAQNDLAKTPGPK